MLNERYVQNFTAKLLHCLKAISFLVFDRVKDNFDFPIHYHPEYEINFILNGKGVRRIVGDHIEEIDDIELGFGRSKFISRMGVECV